MRVDLEFCETMARNEALDLEPVVSELVGDVLEGDQRRLVVGRLEYAAEQNRHVDEGRAGPLLDRADGAMGEIAIGTAEIEMVFDSRFCHRRHHASIQGRRSNSCVQALRG